jgi:hypothetical protein
MTALETVGVIGLRVRSQSISGTGCTGEVEQELELELLLWDRTSILKYWRAISQSALYWIGTVNMPHLNLPTGST